VDVRCRGDPEVATAKPGLERGVAPKGQLAAAAEDGLDDPIWLDVAIGVEIDESAPEIRVFHVAHSTYAP
jgi:hypothetical protein